MIFPKTTLVKLKYLKYFELSEKEGKLVSTYIDQYENQCDFILSELVNSGNELLLMNCGTTKHSSSWAPIHKVKFIKGRLVGSEITNMQRVLI